LLAEPAGRSRLASGRERPAVRWGPRRIDLDLLAHGTSCVDQPGLTLPHPGIGPAFVLVPLGRRSLRDLAVPARPGPRTAGPRDLPAVEGSRR